MSSRRTCSRLWSVAVLAACVGGCGGGEKQVTQKHPNEDLAGSPLPGQGDLGPAADLSTSQSGDLAMPGQGGPPDMVIPTGVMPPPTPVDSANVTWGQPCIYMDPLVNGKCSFPLAQECGWHQGIDVMFPNGPQLLNATLFSGNGCTQDALQDNFNDSQKTLGTDIWMFTDDAAVPGVSAGVATSVIWWVGPLTEDGYPPAGVPTSGCIDYSTATPQCQ